MNVGASAWGYFQMGAAVAQSTGPTQQLGSPLPVWNRSEAGVMLAQALMAAHSLEGFFTSMLGGQPPVRPPLSAPTHAQATSQASAALFGVAASWARPAFATMGPTYGGMAPGAQTALTASGALSMSGALSFGAAFALMAPPRNQFSASASLAARIEEDPYGVSQSGQGVKSNLANSPEVMLAIQALLKEGKSEKFEDLAKGLKEEFGIEAEVGDIKVKNQDGKEVTAKAIKFGNGDYFVDGNGNGQLEAADYKFGDAVKALKEKYHLEDEDLTRITSQMKARAKDTGPGPLAGLHSSPALLYNPVANQDWMMLFFQAYWAAAQS